MTPDITVATTFLKKLGGHKHTFQTFDDHQPKDRKLSRIFYGSLLDHWDALVALNKKGAGIFVTIQKTDGQGRRRENIIGVRAIFQEDDGDGLDLPMQPHIVVETSPGKYHRYLLVKSCPNPDSWISIQARLVKDYGSDPGARDLSRVLRVPGFYHRKGKPFLVRIDNISKRAPYYWEDVAKIFPPVVEKKKINGRALSKEPARIYSALAFLNPDMDYDDWKTILMAIHASDSGEDGLTLAEEWSAEGTKYKEGEVREKWESLRPDGGIGVGTLFHMAMEAGWEGSYVLDDRGKEWYEIEEKSRTRVKVKSPRGRKFDRDLPEGLVRDLAEWSRTRAYISQPVFDLGVGLLGTALLTGNRYVIGGWNTPLQPYLMFSVMTGGGKDHMRRCISEIVGVAGLGDVLSSGYQSAHALFDQLSEGANMVCWLLDEAAEHLKNGMRPGSQDRAVISHILSLYGLGTGRFEGFRGRQKNIDPIDRPFTLIGASAQPEPLAQAANLEYVKDGLLSRFLFLEGSQGKLSRNRKRLNIPLDKFSDNFDEFRGVEVGTSIVFDNAEVSNDVEDFADHCLETASNPGHHNALWTRANQNALMVAGLLAVGQSARKPVITREVWEYAKNLSRQSVKSWLQLISECGDSGGNEEGQIMSRIKYILTDSRVAVKYMREGNEKKIIQEGWISRRALMRGLSAKVRKRGFDDALNWLIEEGSVAQGQFGRLKAYKWVN